MPDGTDLVVVERLIPAPPEPIFELLVHPERHPEIDGSGAVRRSKGDSTRIALGSRFAMAMRMGVPYSMVNTVIDFEENRRVAWQTTGPGALGRRVGGRIWRYELEPVDGGTVVRESWDISEESRLTRGIVRRAADKTRENMASTLERIEALVSSDSER